MEIIKYYFESTDMENFNFIIFFWRFLKVVVKNGINIRIYIKTDWGIYRGESVRTGL